MSVCDSTTDGHAKLTLEKEIAGVTCFSEVERPRSQGYVKQT